MRKPSPTSSRNYFTKETDEWVIKYNQTTDQKERERIFRDHLYYPFYKLAENIINTFKFYYMDVDTVEDLKLDVVRMIFEDKLPGFDPSRGTKAFSYFGTIIKRWLIAYCNANYLRLKKHSKIENYEDVLYEPQPALETAPTMTLASFFDNWIEDMYEQLPEMFPKEEDRAIANAILTVFEKRQDLQLFQKKEIYIYVREITGCDTPYLTKVVNVFKRDFIPKYQKLVKDGYIKTTEEEL